MIRSTFLLTKRTLCDGWYVISTVIKAEIVDSESWLWCDGLKVLGINYDLKTENTNPLKNQSINQIHLLYNTQIKWFAQKSGSTEWSLLVCLQTQELFFRSVLTGWNELPSLGDYSRLIPDYYHWVRQTNRFPSSNTLVWSDIRMEDSWWLRLPVEEGFIQYSQCKNVSTYWCTYTKLKCLNIEAL